MNKKTSFILGSAGFIILLAITSIYARQLPQKGYVMQREKDIAVHEPGPHEGGGSTTAYPFFSNVVPGIKMAFRKRVLYPGSSIGYHLQKEEEIYYILYGHGIMKMNGQSFPIEAGDAVLTRPGSSHGLTPSSGDSLALLITYQLPQLP